MLGEDLGVDYQCPNCEEIQQPCVYMSDVRKTGWVDEQCGYCGQRVRVKVEVHAEATDVEPIGGLISTEG